METLVLSTPLTTGDAVVAAQMALGTNRFGNFHPGVADGVFDERVAHACRRARYWLGYRKAVLEADGGLTYNDDLASFLQDPKHGGRRIGPGMRLRRSSRLKGAAAEAKPIGERALAVAISQLGTKEAPPDSNRVKFSAWYGVVTSWCVEFVAWSFVQVGSTAFAKGARWTYVPFMVAAAQSHQHGLRTVSDAEVRAGDVVAYYWNGYADGVDTHTGIFEAWIDRGAGTFHAIEGNTAIGNDSNGGEVMRRERSTAIAHHFIRVSH